jgi:hypothetical protein
MKPKELQVGKTYTYCQRMKDSTRQWSQICYPVYMGKITGTLPEVDHPSIHLFAWSIKYSWGTTARVDLLPDYEVHEAVCPIDGPLPEFLTLYPTER